MGKKEKELVSKDRWRGSVLTIVISEADNGSIWQVQRELERIDEVEARHVLANEELCVSLAVPGYESVHRSCLSELLSSVSLVSKLVFQTRFSKLVLQKLKGRYCNRLDLLLF